MNCPGEDAGLKEGHHDTSEDMLGGDTDMSVDVVRNPLHSWTMKHIYDLPPIPWTPGYATAVLASNSAGES